MIHPKFAVVLALAAWTLNGKRKQFLEMTELINGSSSGLWTAELAVGLDYDNETALITRAAGSLDNSAFVDSDPDFAARNAQGFPKRPRMLQKNVSSLAGPVESYPKNLDLREKYPNCPSIRSVRNQGGCSSCWAFSAMTALSDRYCIAQKSNTAFQRLFSPQDSLECCPTCKALPTDGCKGGYLFQAYLHAKTNGVVSGDAHENRSLCKPYFIASGDSSIKTGPECQRACATDSPATVTYTSDAVKIKDFIYGKGEAAMVAALNNGGSISVSMTVYQDFYLYKSGIYTRSYGKADGGHAVRLLGYGEENGVKFWIAANSWSKSWGENGFFRIRRGTDECGMESAYFFAGTF